jgi:hypothetical protein
MGDLGQTTVVLRWFSAAALVGLLIYGALKRRGQDERRRYWPQVRGRLVTDRDQGYGTGGGATFDSVVVFTTLDGRIVQGSPRGGLYLGKPVAGRGVPVWYDPRDPNLFEARIYALDRAGSLSLLAALLPAILLTWSFLS